MNKYHVDSIVFRAMTLAERIPYLTKSFSPSSSNPDTQLIEKWIQTVTDGDRDTFEKRLSWDGLDFDTLQNLCEMFPPLNLKIPTWGNLLYQLLDFNNKSANRTLSPKPTAQNSPILFEEVWMPVILFAREQVIKKLNLSDIQEISEQYPFSVTAYESFEEELLTILSWISANALYEKFSLFRPIELSIQGLSEPIDIDGDTYYSNFVKHHVESGLSELFFEFPVLARFISISVLNWINGTCQIITRTKNDLPEITDLVGGEHGNVPLQIKSVQLSLSDLHYHGQSVSIFTLTNGAKVVYKPRSLKMDQAMSALIDWCHGAGTSLDIKVPCAIDKKEYGWVEFVAYGECLSETDVENYYHRIGMILAIAYILGGNDFHHENIIAAGAYPVMLDFESLFHHRANLFDKSLETAALESGAETLFWDSVLRTGLLPQWIYDKNEKTGEEVTYDISGMGGTKKQKLLENDRYWESPNTDAMRPARKRAYTDVLANVVRLNGKICQPEPYMSFIIDGFSELYNLFQSHKDWLVNSSESPLTKFPGTESRFIFRATQNYSYVRSRLLLSKNLKSGVAMSIEIDLLARTYLYSDDKSFAWAMLQQETEDLSHLDIPHFTIPIDKKVLTLRNGVNLPNLLKESSYKEVQERIEKMDQPSLARQILYIKASLFAQVQLIPQEPETTSIKSQTVSLGKPLSYAEIMTEVNSIVISLLNSSISGQEDTVAWLGLNPILSMNRLQFHPLGWDMYSGIMGVSLFLSAYSKYTNDLKTRSIVLNSLKPLRKFAHEENWTLQKALLKGIGFGGYNGLGSLIYGFCKTHEFLEEQTLVDEAVIISQLITEKDISDDRELDVVKGSAGLLLSLLKLYELTSLEHVLEKAKLCGNHLVSKQIASDSSGGIGGWLIHQETHPLAGMLHGAAGISMALVKLYHHTGEENYLDAALMGMQYEDSLYDSTQNNWKDLRESAEAGVCSATWCNGAPGIGMSRLSMLAYITNDEIHKDIVRSLMMIEAQEFSTIDHLCCGNFGRIETMRVAASRLNKPQLLYRATEMASQLVYKANLNGGYKTLEHAPSNLQSIGFFQGIAGIGYALLGVAEPSLPSLLLWE